MSRIRSLLKPKVVVSAAVVGAVLVGFGLYWFQPWKLFQDETVNEALPGISPTASAPPAGKPAAEPSAEGSPAPSAPAGPKTLVRGEFISHEHETRGSVQVLELADGSRVLRLTDLETSNGPDLRVWITDAPVKEGTAGWRVFDDGEYVSLGKLKGNKGSQNYVIPAEVNLDDFGSVSIWCDRFDVSFGAAELREV
ncbi:DM13 domain-containing protein [Streptomyces sp. TRM66268-LWL]|uniref:DM13 domain-containing protein n=1 Tax=Streptomyces polyasparticus TaxID=2767826 RepID=A0ABR7SGI0_9ACTN|nr:DM13 domain-containing protein [Streptomyces polyasparticus]MBC9714592.1 DM13 domain-containing protein [Streptomyces polyasparticus]